MAKFRIDQLPMDRRQSLQSAIPGRTGRLESSPKSVFEVRDVEPTAATFKRRTGSNRLTNTAPNLLGIGKDDDGGDVFVDKNFGTNGVSEIVTGNGYTLIFSVKIEDPGLTTAYFPICHFHGIWYYIYWTGGDTATFKAIEDGGTERSSLDLSQNTGNFNLAAVVTSAGGLTTYEREVTEGLSTASGSTSPSFPAYTNLYLSFLGDGITGKSPVWDGVTVGNAMIYDNVLTLGEIDTVSNDATPPLNTGATSAYRRWHQTFNGEGEVLTNTDLSGSTFYTYLRPFRPTKQTSTSIAGDSTELHFGGDGVIEIPYYLDFDEYFWTPTKGDARRDWQFQIILKTPAELVAGAVILEFEDWFKLELVSMMGQIKFYASFHGRTGATDAVIQGEDDDGALQPNTEYRIWAGRDTTENIIAGVANTIFISVGGDESAVDDPAADVTGTSGDYDAANPNPKVFDLTKSLGLIIGGPIDPSDTKTFKGTISRVALFNATTLAWGKKEDAVFYYDADSIHGDEIRDRGPRKLNGIASSRNYAPRPWYKEGPVAGGSYVGAAGGYYFSSGSPKSTHAGAVEKAITKDVTIQRIGERAFFASNGKAYVSNDLDLTFRAMGVPKPGTKVSCHPTGLGPIDGVVSYGYRWLTTDGTVGPPMRLDPIDARGGVNVLLGGEGAGGSSGYPSEPAFGMTWGELEGTNQSRGDASGNTNESFRFIDQKDSVTGTQYLNDAGDTVTAEVAFRIPEAVTPETDESIFAQGAKAPDNTQGSCYARNDTALFGDVWGSGDEFCIQFAFKYDSSQAHQVLFAVGRLSQRYRTGSITRRTHYEVPRLVVSLQPAKHSSNGAEKAIVVTRQTSPARRDNSTIAQSYDCHLVNGQNYSVFVHRGAIEGQRGRDLIVQIYSETDDDWTSVWTDLSYRMVGVTETSGGWPATTNYMGNVGWWGDFSVPNTARQGTKMLWGTGRVQGSASGVKTKRRATTGAGYAFAFIHPLPKNTVWYHARAWKTSPSINQLERHAIKRYGADVRPLSDALYFDIAWCPDSSLATLESGWDRRQDMSVPFRNDPRGAGVAAIAGGGGAITRLDFNVVLGAATHTPILVWGHNVDDASLDFDKIPAWLTYCNRNGGSLSWGVGNERQGEIVRKKWQGDNYAEMHSSQLIPTSFDPALDFSQWTWFTAVFEVMATTGIGGATRLITSMNRVYINGVTGEWGSIEESAGASVSANSNNADASSTDKNTLFEVGAPKNFDSKLKLDIAEVRVWDGERYYSEGYGNTQSGVPFGDYLSNRVPANDWDKMHHYGRFVPNDANGTGPGYTSLNNKGIFAQTTGDASTQQQQSAAITFINGAEIVDASSESTVSIAVADTTNFVPFPTPPNKDIRGIEIFRSQVIPVRTTFLNGEPNPEALKDAWEVAHSAPLYFVSELTRGTNFFTDVFDDSQLGFQLDFDTGRVPENPRGIFEWGGRIGLFTSDESRVHFSESPTQFESFPNSLAYDLPAREFSRIQAGCELASRDQRRSRALVLGDSWGAFLDGSPDQPQVNSLGGGVGASSPRCLVVNSGIAYAYNGTLWAITGDGQIEDIGLPILDLLPDPANTRLSVSSKLSSLFVIDETTGIALRYHFSRRQWFVEDRNALSVTDIAGKDTWVHVSGYPSEGDTTIYQDDIITGSTAAIYAVASYSNGSNTVTLTGYSSGQLKEGMRLTLTATAGGDSDGVNSPLVKQTVTITSVNDGTSTMTVDSLSLTANDSAGTAYKYHAVPGVGEFGTMIDTGQFALDGVLRHVDIGISAGDRWYISFDASDFAKSPTDRTGFDVAGSLPVNIVNSGGTGTSSRWGANNSQRVERLLIWSPSGSSAELTEVEAEYRTRFDT